MTPLVQSSPRDPSIVVEWLEHTSTYACHIDSHGKVLCVGPNLLCALGLSREEPLPHAATFSQLVAIPEERAKVEALIASENPLERREAFDTTLLPGKGLPTRRVRWSLVVVGGTEEASEYVAMGWSREDLPRLQHQMSNLSRLTELTSEAVMLVSSRGAIDYVNQSFCTLSGYSVMDVIGLSVSAFVSIPEDISVVQGALACFRRDEMWKGALKMRRKDGSVMFVDVRVQPLFDTPGVGRRYLVLGSDHSRQKTLERQVEELQRLEALGTLSNGLAHRFNNILAAISGQTELLIMSSTDPDVKQRAGKILESALRGKEVVEQLGLFGRRNEPRSRLADLVPVVRNAVRFIRAAQPRCVQIEENIPDRSPEVMANTGEIHQVLVNLLANSLEAIGAKQGKITVSLRSEAVRLAAEEDVRNCVVIEVRDDGPGIPEEIQHRIFEPFFTTHGLASSSGMGLAITHGIIQRHGGLVECESAPGAGALFRLSIPVYEPGRMERPLSGSAGASRPPILLVDKEGFLLDSGKRVLEDLGYDVTATSSMEAAKEFLGDRSKNYRLLITALHLGEECGVSLSRTSRRMRPGMPVLLCANLSEAFDEDAAMDAGASAILRRPASREQLADVVAKLMDCNA